MKLVVGLGNPGEKYAGTRHNVGFVVVDRLVGEEEFKMEKKFKSEIVRMGEVLVAKPQSFMNKSGDVVSEVVRFYKVETDDLWVIHDDLDIRLGSYKVQKGVGPKVHNGVGNIEERLGENEFWRVRVGVDNRESREVSGEEYVLGKFRSSERKVLGEVIERVTVDLIDKLGLSR